MSDWFAGTRSTAPPQIEMLSTEDRILSVGIADMLAVGESVSGLPTVSIVDWRTRIPVTPTPNVGASSYDIVNKVVAQRVDGSLCPVRKHLAILVTFVVNPGAVERAAFVMLWLPV